MAVRACQVSPPAVEFVEPLDENLTCQICHEVMSDPRTVKCGHCFCRECIMRWLTRGGSGRGPRRGSCPLCRKNINSDGLRPIPPFKALIEALKVYCRYKTNGCREIIPLGEVESHSASCMFASVECSDCSEVIIQHSLGSHIAEFHPSGTQKKLKDRISRLEEELHQTTGRLRQSEVEKAVLESEILELTSIQNGLEVTFDMDYQYGDTPASVVDLARFISYHFRNKPGYVNRNRLYECVGRCRVRYMHGQHILNVLMLLAVAAASDWFSENQSNRIQEWLEGCPHRNDSTETDDSTSDAYEDETDDSYEL